MKFILIELVYLSMFSKVKITYSSVLCEPKFCNKVKYDKASFKLPELKTLKS